MRKSRFLAFVLALVLLMALALPALAENRVLFKSKNYEELGLEEEYFWNDVTAGDGQALYVLTSSGNHQQVFRYAPGDAEPVMVHENESLYGSYPSAENEMSDEQKKQGAETIGTLVGGDRVMAINYYTLRLGALDEGGITWGENPMELPDMMVSEGEYSYFRGMNSAFIDGDKIYVGVQTDDWNSTNLYVVDIESGKVENQYELKNMRYFTRYKPGQVLACVYGDVNESGDPKSGKVDIVAINYETGEKTVLLSGISDTYTWAGGMAWKEDTDEIYYSINSQAFRLPAGAKEALPIAYLSVGYVSENNVGTVVGDTYALGTYEGVFLCDAENDLSGVSPVRVQGTYRTKGMTKFADENPDTPVVNVEKYYNSSEEIATAIQTGTDQLDIFTSSIGNAGYGALKRKGYMADLSGSQVISDLVDHLQPTIAAACKDDQGRIVAVPYEAYLNSWNVDMALWEYAFPGQELPKTFSEWLTLYQEWEDTHDEDEDFAFFRSYEPKNELMYQAFNQFVTLSEREGNGVDFSDPAFREVMQQIEALPFEPLDWENMTEEDYEEMNEYTNIPTIFQFYNGGAFSDPEQEQYNWRYSEDEEYSDLAKIGSLQMPYPVPVFTEDQEPLYTINLEVFFVNPNSKNLAGAIKLLEYQVQDLGSHYTHMLRTDMTEPVRSTYYERNIIDMQKNLDDQKARLEEATPEEKQELEDSIRSTELYLAWFEKNGQWEITEGGIKNYQENIAPYLFANANPLLGYDGENSAGQIINDILWRYQAGEINLDEMIGEMTQKARMIQQEAQ